MTDSCEWTGHCETADTNQLMQTGHMEHMFWSHAAYDQNENNVKKWNTVGMLIYSWLCLKYILGLSQYQNFKLWYDISLKSRINTSFNNSAKNGPMFFLSFISYIFIFIYFMFLGFSMILLLTALLTLVIYLVNYLFVDLVFHYNVHYLIIIETRVLHFVLFAFSFISLEWQRRMDSLLERLS